MVSGFDNTTGMKSIQKKPWNNFSDLHSSKQLIKELLMLFKHLFKFTQFQTGNEEIFNGF